MTRKFLVPIVLPADPAAALEAATKQYVDNTAAGAGFVLKTGDTMTGTLSNDRRGTATGEGFKLIGDSAISPFVGFWDGATRVGYIQGRPLDPSVRLVSDTGFLAFFANGAEAARFDTGGIFLVGKAAVGITTNGFQVPQATGTVGYTSDLSQANLSLNKTVLTSGHTYIDFRNTNTIIGSITRNAATAAVLYNTSSDYRLKDDHGPIIGARERIALLTPRRFVWKDDEAQTEQDGFFAHEVAEVVPEAVTGEKDAVAVEDDEDRGLVKGQIVAQQLDASRLVPLLVAAVQELSAEVELLRVRITELEAA